jgi:hypothetical protein
MNDEKLLELPKEQMIGKIKMLETTLNKVEEAFSS